MWSLMNMDCGSSSKASSSKYLEYIANDDAHWTAESPKVRDAMCRILTLTILLLTSL